jgi:Tfp pilus assembly pilus retraction ATPase PilT
MQVGGQHGMQTMDQSLASLVRTGRIETSVALERAGDEQGLRRLLGLPAGSSLA